MFQQCMIIGNLGKDPEMRYTPDGTPVTDFTIAVSRKKGDGTEKTTWFKVTCWRKLAEVTNQYLKKGRQVMVIGEVEAEAYMGTDGQPRSSLKLTANEVKFLGSPRDDAGGGSGSGAASGGFGSGPTYAQEEEDIPF